MGLLMVHAEQTPKNKERIVPTELTALWHVDFIQVNIGGQNAKACAG